MNWSPKPGSFSTLMRPQYRLLALTAALGAIYLALIWRSGDQAHLGMSLLFGMAAGNLLWERRHSLQFGSSFGAMGLGVLLIGAILLSGSAKQVDQVPLIALRLMPLILALGVCLLASGFRLKQYWQELTILFFLGAPSVLARFLPDISPLTAKCSALLLWYFGFDISISGVVLRLPTGAVEVYHGCSGIESVTYLLGISVVCLLSFPIEGVKRFFIPGIAILIGFFVNLVRVSLMVILAASGDKAAFTFWHVGQGSSIFGAAAILLFGLFYFFVMQQSRPDQTHQA